MCDGVMLTVLGAELAKLTFSGVLNRSFTEEKVVVSDLESMEQIEGPLAVRPVKGVWEMERGGSLEVLSLV